MVYTECSVIFNLDYVRCLPSSPYPSKMRIYLGGEHHFFSLLQCFLFLIMVSRVIGIKIFKYLGVTCIVLKKVVHAEGMLVILELHLIICALWRLIFKYSFVPQIGSKVLVISNQTRLALTSAPPYRFCIVVI